MAAASKRTADRSGVGGCESRRRRGSKSKPASRLIAGDCLEAMAALKPESVDVVICDPPYGIAFQNEPWDQRAILATARAEAGEKLSPPEAFELWIRLWAEQCLRVMKPGAFLLAFGSPRTYHRLVCGIEDAGLEIRDTLMWLYGSGMSKSRRYPGGRATALKPAFEPIVVARRPLEGWTPENLRRHGTGALNVEACAIGTEGRMPANVAISHEPDCTEGSCTEGCPVALADGSAIANVPDSGARPSRIFYCSKAPRREREEGCEELPAQALNLFPGKGGGKPSPNPHPTVKPLSLMRWLVALACPPGGVVLDPTCGSGSTGCAAAMEGRRFIGIESERAYLEIARARIAHHGGCRPTLDRGRRPLAKRRRP